MQSKNPQKSEKLTDGEEQFDKDPLPDKIGKNLRKIYDDVLSEPVPDDFLSLLAQADENKK